MIPFNIELYNTGNYDVVYRNGQVPDDWYYSERANKVLSLHERTGTYAHSADGLSSQYRDYDLMLKPKEKRIEFYFKARIQTGSAELTPKCCGIEGREFLDAAYPNHPHLYRIRINQTTYEATIEKIA